MTRVKEYTNGEVTVVWESEKCIHSAICAKGLPRVFRPKDRPWIKMDAAQTEFIVNQVKQCPSGALSYYMNNEKDKKIEHMETKVVVKENGPLLVHGNLHLVHKDGTEEAKDKVTAFCRCGGSNNKPFCDGTHSKNAFED